MNIENKVDLDEFVKKVRKMTAQDLIMSMVKGLQKEWVTVEMNSFGYTRYSVCFGCAATNAICEILQLKTFVDSPRWSDYALKDSEFQTLVEASRYQFILYLEKAFDCLRRGNIVDANWYLNYIKCSTITSNNTYLPALDNDNYLSNLNAYIELANLQN